jgi:hypothetical protein
VAGGQTSASDGCLVHHRLVPELDMKVNVVAWSF